MACLVVVRGGCLVGVCARVCVADAPRPSSVISAVLSPARRY